MTIGAREEKLKAYAAEAIQRLVRAGELLASRQTLGGPTKGNVPPWPESDDLDFHGTLSAVWIWHRAQRLASDDRFALNIAAAWAFIDQVWERFIPNALSGDVSEEAPYDCAMVLRAAISERGLQSHVDVADPGASHQPPAAPATPRAEAAARLLGAYLTDLQDLGGREFKDPGFLAWNLADYAREVGDRGLLATACRFVERAFGMKVPPPFRSEPATTDGLFDFSCTTATRVLAVIAAEGATPFVGAWLRERVAGATPSIFVERPLEENTWNACAAAAIGRSFVVSTDPRFFEAHQSLMADLDLRSMDGGLGRAPKFPAETRATFYYALAVDALVKL